MRIICLGDELTAAPGLPEGDRWPTILQGRLDQWQSGRFDVYNCGQAGDTSFHVHERFVAEVAPHLPGLVITCLGFNDADVRPGYRQARVCLDGFRRNLSAIAGLCIVRSSVCILLVPHPPVLAKRDQGDGVEFGDHAVRYLDLVRSTARDLDLRLIDLPRMMAERKRPVSDLVGADGASLSPEGNHHWAEMVFDGLRPILEEHGQGTRRAVRSGRTSAKPKRT